MKKAEKITALILSLLILTGCFGITAFADEDISYEWSQSDGKWYCTASADGTSETAEAKGEVKVPATCTEKGTTTYTAVFENGLFGEQTTDKEDIEALGHSFTDYVSNCDATEEADGTKTAKCDRCDAADTVTDEGSKLIILDGPGMVYIFRCPYCAQAEYLKIKYADNAFMLGLVTVYHAVFHFFCQRFNIQGEING